MLRLAALMFASSVALAADPPPRADAGGFPLPPEAVRRFGSAQFLAGNASRVAFSADGKTVFTAGSYFPVPGQLPSVGTIAAWDFATGKRLWIAEDTGYVSRLEADPNGRDMWATAQGKGSGVGTLVRLRLSARTGEVTERTELFARFGSHALHPTGLVAWARFDTQASDLSLPITGPDGKEVARWEPEGEFIEAVTLAPDGKTVFIAGPEFRSQKYKLRAVEVATGKGKWVADCPATNSLLVSPDGTRVVAHGRGEVIPVTDPGFKGMKMQNSRFTAWDAATGKQLGVATVDSLPFGLRGDGMGKGNEVATFASDGKTLFALNLDRQSVPINTATWTAGEPVAHRASVGTFRPDGKAYIVIGGRNLQLFDAATHKPLPQSPPSVPYEANSGIAITLAFAPDGAALTRTGRGPDAITWAVATGKESKREPIRMENRSPDGKWLLRPASDSSWEVAAADGKTAFVLEQSRANDVVRFSSDGRFIVAASLNGVRIWGATGGKPTDLPPPNGRGSGVIDNLRIDPTGARAAVIEPRTFGGRAGEIVGLYDLAAAKRTGAVAVAGRIAGWGYSPAGRLVVVTALEGPPRGALTVVRPNSDAADKFDLDFPPSAFAVAPDERTVAIGAANGVHLLDLRTGQRRHTFTGLSRPAEVLAFSPDGKIPASESADGPVLLWDVRGGLRPTPVPDAAALARLWADLGSDDATKAFAAVRAAAAHPAQAVPSLKRAVAEWTPPAAADLAARVAKLGAKEFAERDTAEKELRAAGAVAHPALKAALKADPSAELRARAGRLLAETESPPARRARRLAEAAEWAGADTLLANWCASDWPELRAEADAARKRLPKK